MPRYVSRPNHPQADEFGMVEADIAGPKYGGDTAFGVISDTMAATKHMADGKMYDSKSEFRKATKNAGCIEVGNEMATVTAPRKPIQLSRADRRDAIRQAISQLR